MSLFNRRPAPVAVTEKHEKMFRAWEADSTQEVLKAPQSPRCTCDDFCDGPCPVHPNMDDPYTGDVTETLGGFNV